MSVGKKSESVRFDRGSRVEKILNKSREFRESRVEPSRVQEAGRIERTRSRFFFLLSPILLYRLLYCVLVQAR